MEFDLKKTLEALLISTVEPISSKDLVQVFDRYNSQIATKISENDEEEASEEVYAPKPVHIKQSQIETLLAELINEAEIQNKAYRIVEGPNGYQILTAPQFADYVRLLRDEPRPLKLSPAALETLSIIAYRQPVTRAEMESIRGVAVDGPLNRLIEMELVLVVGRADLPGRPIQYGTTDKFLEFIGIKSLEALPASDVLNNYQIDSLVQSNVELQTIASDKDVGLAEERESSKSTVDWQMENIESDNADSDV